MTEREQWVSAVMGFVFASMAAMDVLLFDTRDTLTYGLGLIATVCFALPLPSLVGKLWRGE